MLLGFHRNLQFRVLFGFQFAKQQNDQLLDRLFLHQFLFLKILSNTFFLYLNIFLVILDQLIHQIPLGDILPEIPCDTAALSHCDFYVYICSFLHITPQAAGNMARFRFNRSRRFLLKSHGSPLPMSFW